MEVRAFRKEDTDNVKELILSILTKEYPFDRSAFSDSDLYDLTSSYSGTKDHFFVAEDLGKIVGTVGIKEDSKETALLRRLFVDSEYRRQGYGGMLIDEALAFCREKGYSSVVFRTTNRMTGAIELCLKKGFRKAEELNLGGFQIFRFVKEI